MDKQILRKFLRAGYMEKRRLYFTELGTEQGSIISPTLALMALSGIEGRIRDHRKRTRDKEKINFISYADDFIITGESTELLEEKVIPIVIESLKEVGLELSQEKSKITHIDNGFDFLGFNVRKYRGTLLIKPSKENIKKFLTEIRNTIKANYSAKTKNLINLLNPKIRGWANYYRSSVSSKAFSDVDDKIYKTLKSWMLRRHPNKSKSWINRKYFIRRGLSNWNFHAMVRDEKGNNTPLYLYRAGETAIKRHIKIKSDAHPYDPKFKDYFKHRENTSKTRIVNSNSRSELSIRLLGDNVALLRA